MRIVEIDTGFITVELVPEDAQYLAAACEKAREGYWDNNERSALIAGLYRAMASALEAAALAAIQQPTEDNCTPRTLSELRRCPPGVITIIRGGVEAEEAVAA